MQSEDATLTTDTENFWPSERSSTTHLWVAGGIVSTIALVVVAVVLAWSTFAMFDTDEFDLGSAVPSTRVMPSPVVPDITSALRAPSSIDGVAADLVVGAYADRLLALLRDPATERDALATWARDVAVVDDLLTDSSVTIDGSAVTDVAPGPEKGNSVRRPSSVDLGDGFSLAVSAASQTCTVTVKPEGPKGERVWPLASDGPRCVDRR